MSNISIANPNFVYLDNFFYTMDEDSQLLLKVTFDGSTAFCYTLDVPLQYEVQSLDYDGYGFWSLERGSDRIIIRRWVIDNLICRQVDKFSVVSSVSETIDAYALAIESYDVSFSGDESSGQVVLSVTDGNNMSQGDKLLLGPNMYGQKEYVIVDSASSTSVTLDSPTVFGYSAGDQIRFYKYGYFFNNADGTDTSTGSLYKFDVYTGSIVRKEAGTQYKGVRAASIGTVADRNGNPVIYYDDDGVADIFKALLFIKGNLLFITDIYSSGYFRLVSSMLLDIDNSTVTFDLTTRGSVLYYLVSGYDYSVAQFDITVMSVSVSAYPAVLPADGVSTSLITATVLDQYNNPIPQKIVKFTASDGSLSSTQDITNDNGVATVTFISSHNVGTVDITAEVSQI